MAWCTFLSTWNLNGSWVNTLCHSISKELGIHLQKAELEANAALSSTKAMSEHLGNLCDVLDGAGNGFVHEAVPQICVYKSHGVL